MKYNFDEIVVRRGTDCIKWDRCDDGVLPLWIADMDFKAAPAIQKAIVERTAHDVYGYVNVPQEYYDAVTGWFSRRHGWNFQATEIIHTIGVVPAIAAALRATTRPGDKVVIQSPVYNCFFACIRNLECTLIDSPLIYKDAHYEIDFEDLESKLADPEVKVFLMCNPHNPAGRIWTKAELTKIGEICLRHGVTVVSDEIHCEFAFEGYEYTPFASISEEFATHSIICTAASKAFNVAGLMTANITVHDPALREKVVHAVETHEVDNMNPFGMVALIAAYNESEDWLDEMMQYIEGNYRSLATFFAENLPQFTVTKMEGTYLAWIKIPENGPWPNATSLVDEVLKTQKVRFNAGAMYGNDGFLRINLACPRALLMEALERFKTHINNNDSLKI